MSDHREWANVVVSNVSRVSHSLSLFNLCLSSSCDPLIVPSYGNQPFPLIRTLRRSFSIPVSIPTYGIPRTTPHRWSWWTSPTRDRLKRRSISSFAVARVKEFNARRFVRKYNRIMNRTSVMTRRRNSHVTHAELREIASVEAISHRRISHNLTITFSHIPENFFNAVANGNPLICIWRILNNVVHCHARAVILDSLYFFFFFSPPTTSSYFLSLSFFFTLHLRARPPPFISCSYPIIIFSINSGLLFN